MNRSAPSNDNATPLSATARDWREGRRLRALELIASGYRPSEIARILAVTPSAISQWCKRAKSGGPLALLRKKSRGREARMSAEQLKQLRLGLARPPAAGWTTRQVAAFIVEAWGIHYSRAQVSRIMRALGVGASRRA